MESNSQKGTMRPLGLQSSAGQFGLKKHINLPPELKEKLEKEEEIENVQEIKEAESIPTVEAESTMKKPEEEGKVEEITESFECPVCGKEFSKKIGLIGHLRGPCGKKSKK